ncbi:MAG: MscL family protein [Bacilli bacterium]
MAKIKIKKQHNLWKEFKAFISRGSVLDMAVGVVIGGAFGAIVTALVNILLSVCAWGVPGGIGGLVTPLPALSSAQHAPAGYFDSYSILEFITLSKTWSVAEQSMYTKYGGSYYYNGIALINWGALINAVISFVIIALVLFVIIKVVAVLKAKRLELDARIKEQYYAKHPEERPVAPVPGKPAPTQIELLTQIRDSLVKQKNK